MYLSNTLLITPPWLVKGDHVDRKVVSITLSAFSGQAQNGPSTQELKALSFGVASMARLEPCPFACDLVFLGDEVVELWVLLEVVGGEGADDVDL